MSTITARAADETEPGPLELPTPDGAAVVEELPADEGTIDYPPLPRRQFDGDWSSTARTPFVYAAISPWVGSWGGWAWNPYLYPWGGGYHPRYWAYMSVADSLYRPWWYAPYHFRPNWQSQYLPYYGSGRAGFAGPGGWGNGVGPAGQPGWWNGPGGWGQMDAIWAPWGVYCGASPMPCVPPTLPSYGGCFYW